MLSVITLDVLKHTCKTRQCCSTQWCIHAFVDLGIVHTKFSHVVISLFCFKLISINHKMTCYGQGLTSFSFIVYECAMKVSASWKKVRGLNYIRVESKWQIFCFWRKLFFNAWCTSNSSTATNMPSHIFSLIISHKLPFWFTKTQSLDTKMNTRYTRNVNTRVLLLKGQTSPLMTHFIEPSTHWHVHLLLVFLPVNLWTPACFW